MTVCPVVWRERFGKCAACVLLPVVAVESSVVDGFAEVGDADVFAVGEVGDGAADAEDFVMCAGGQAHVFHGLFEQ